jgi:hypothetical protein
MLRFASAFPGPLGAAGREVMNAVDQAVFSCTRNGSCSHPADR